MQDKCTCLRAHPGLLCGSIESLIGPLGICGAAVSKVVIMCAGKGFLASQLLFGNDTHIIQH